MLFPHCCRLKSFHHVGGKYAELNFLFLQISQVLPPRRAPLQIVASCEHHVGGWPWVASSPKLESNDKAVKPTRRQIICFLRFNWNQRQKNFKRNQRHTNYKWNQRHKYVSNGIRDTNILNGIKDTQITNGIRDTKNSD